MHGIYASACAYRIQPFGWLQQNKRICETPERTGHGPVSYTHLDVYKRQEAAEMKKLQLQVAEYEKILQEMRKLNYKNAELSEKIDVLVGENAGKLQGLQEDEQKLLSTLRDLTEEQTRNREEELSRKAEEKQDVQQDTKAQTKDIIAQTQELMTRSEDFVHKENVKVYRNVPVSYTHLDVYKRQL